MKERLREIVAQLTGDSGAGRIVPPTGATAQLAVFSAAAMAFLAVFALALSLATGRLADRWDAGLARTATVRIAAPPDQLEAQTRAVLDLLATSPGIEGTEPLSTEQTQALLQPWFGPDLPIDALAIPTLISVAIAEDGFDAENIRLRLTAEAPGAILDDHTGWRRPLIAAAERLRAIGLFSLVLIGAAGAGMITLAAQASLAANGQVVRVMRLIGARDTFIARAFVRRLTLRALAGAIAGTGAGMLVIALLPPASDTGGFLTGLGFQGWGWLWPLIIPPLAGAVAFGATRASAYRSLRSLT